MLKNTLLVKILTLVSFVGMVTVNALANILPINGIDTGAVSDAYPNLFAPAGVTFSIWGVIYLCLAAYVVYQFLPQPAKRAEIFRQLNLWFILSSLVNATWIFFWHYQQMGVTVILMLVLLFSLIKISAITNEKSLSTKDKLMVKIPFGLYFGWITIATIANITTLLVSIGWKNWILPDEAWMIVILLVGAVIASITAIKARNLAYGLVPVWAYFGIYLKHTSPLFFNNMYPSVIFVIVLCLSVFIGVNGYLVVKKKYL